MMEKGGGETRCRLFLSMSIKVAARLTISIYIHSINTADGFVAEISD